MNQQPPSRRELEVARYMSHGLTRRMTASALHVTPETVATHTRHLREKLNAKNTMHAVCECLRRGLID